MSFITHKVEGGQIVAACFVLTAKLISRLQQNNKKEKSSISTVVANKANVQSNH